MTVSTYTLEAMKKYGGGFVKQLAILAWTADSINMKKLEDTFPEYFSQYEKWGRELEMEASK